MSAKRQRAAAKAPVLATVIVVLSIAFGSSNGASAAGDQNLLRNAPLTEGAGGVPSDWRAASHNESANDGFLWVRQPGSDAELRLINARPDLSHWGQTVSLSRGWYRLTGAMRAEGLQPNRDWALIGIHLQRNTYGLSFPDPADSAGWKTGTLYFKVGKPQTIEITCELEGSGDVSFRNSDADRSLGCASRLRPADRS